MALSFDDPVPKCFADADEKPIPTEKEHGQFFCGHCKDTISIDFKFCPYCGKEINWLMSQVCRPEYT